MNAIDYDEWLHFGLVSLKGTGASVCVHFLLMMSLPMQIVITNSFLFIHHGWGFLQSCGNISVWGSVRLHHRYYSIWKQVREVLIHFQHMVEKWFTKQWWCYKVMRPWEALTKWWCHLRVRACAFIYFGIGSEYDILAGGMFKTLSKSSFFLSWTSDLQDV